MRLGWPTLLVGPYCLCCAIEEEGSFKRTTLSDFLDDEALGTYLKDASRCNVVRQEDFFLLLTFIDELSKDAFIDFLLDSAINRLLRWVAIRLLRKTCKLTKLESSSNYRNLKFAFVFEWVSYLPFKMSFVSRSSLLSEGFPRWNRRKVFQSETIAQYTVKYLNICFLQGRTRIFTIAYRRFENPPW